MKYSRLIIIGSLAVLTSPFTFNIAEAGNIEQESPASVSKTEVDGTGTTVSSENVDPIHKNQIEMSNEGTGVTPVSATPLKQDQPKTAKEVFYQKVKAADQYLQEFLKILREKGTAAAKEKYQWATTMEKDITHYFRTMGELTSDPQVQEDFESFLQRRKSADRQYQEKYFEENQSFLVDIIAQTKQALATLKESTEQYLKVAHTSQRIAKRSELLSDKEKSGNLIKRLTEFIREGSPLYNQYTALLNEWNKQKSDVNLIEAGRLPRFERGSSEAGTTNNERASFSEEDDDFSSDENQGNETEPEEDESDTETTNTKAKVIETFLSKVNQVKKLSQNFLNKLQGNAPLPAVTELNFLLVCERDLLTDYQAQPELQNNPDVQTARNELAKMIAGAKEAYNQARLAAVEQALKALKQSKEQYLKASTLHAIEASYRHMLTSEGNLEEQLHLLAQQTFTPTSPSWNRYIELSAAANKLKKELGTIKASHASRIATRPKELAEPAATAIPERLTNKSETINIKNKNSLSREEPAAMSSYGLDYFEPSEIDDDENDPDEQPPSTPSDEEEAINEPNLPPEEEPKPVSSENEEGKTRKPPRENKNRVDVDEYFDHSDNLENDTFSDDAASNEEDMGNNYWENEENPENNFEEFYEGSEDEQLPSLNDATDPTFFYVGWLLLMFSISTLSIATFKNRMVK